jgi:hypothetical protein
VRDELLAPVPVVEQPLGRPEDSGPPPVVAVPPAASEPEAVEPLPEAIETADVPEAAINAAADAGSSATDDATTESADAEAADSGAEPQKQTTLSEPTTGELSAEEASILAVLAQSGRSDDDRTALAVATSLERETTDVAAVLRKLGNEGVVSGELYTAGGDKIWAVTERGVRRLGAQH